MIISYISLQKVERWIFDHDNFIFFSPKGGGGGGADGHVHGPLDRVHLGGAQGILATGLSLPLQMPRLLVTK